MILYLSNKFSLPITRSYPFFDTNTMAIVPASETIVEVPIAPLIALFLLISSAAHLFIGSILYERYVKNLKKGMNPYRWYEYSVSASLML